ncbi:MAG: ATP-binding protein [Candidatus Krumholzibacteriota bacterium]
MSPEKENKVDHRGFLRRRADLATAGFEAAESPMLVINPDGEIAVASKGAGTLLGMENLELVGLALENLFVPPSSVTHCGEEGHCSTSMLRQLQVRHAGGDVVPVEVQCSPFSALYEGLDTGGDPERNNHCLMLLADIRKRDLEDQMRAARLAKLSLLNQVSEALYGANLSLDQILEAVLICMTAGQGLRFNRAFLLLVNETDDQLRGEIAIGPSNAEEASRIWQDLADQPGDLFEMMTSYDQSIKQTDVAVNEIVRNLSVSLEDEEHILVRVMADRHVLRVRGDTAMPGVQDVRRWLGSGEFAVAPLTTRAGSIGVILADNAISGTEISDLDLEFLQMFANQSAGAIENSRLYSELEQRLLDLRRAHQKQKDDQETLMRMERLSVMGETSAIVAHELRNPLVAIGGFARSLKRSLDEDDPNRQSAEIISSEVARMETIIHDLLDFIRPRKRLRKEVVVDRIVAETADKFATELQNQGIRVGMELKTGGIALDVHPGEIQQVLQNFIVNAMQAQPEGGRIEIRSRMVEGGVEVEVRDDGPGFAEDVGDQLYSPFFSTKTTGSGLGLTICSQIIKSHGGVTGAENLPEGGAAFSFILPLPRNAPEA